MRKTRACLNKLRVILMRFRWQVCWPTRQTYFYLIMHEAWITAVSTEFAFCRLNQQKIPTSCRSYIVNNFNLQRNPAPKKKTKTKQKKQKERKSCFSTDDWFITMKIGVNNLKVCFFKILTQWRILGLWIGWLTTPRFSFVFFFFLKLIDFCFVWWIN